MGPTLRYPTVSTLVPMALPSGGTNTPENGFSITASLMEGVWKTNSLDIKLIQQTW